MKISLIAKITEREISVSGIALPNSENNRKPMAVNTFSPNTNEGTLFSLYTTKIGKYPLSQKQLAQIKRF